MATLKQYFQNAELSVAAYADLFPGMSITDYLGALTQVAGMSVTQAREFIGVDQSDLVIPGKGYEIVDQLPNTISGFSATADKKWGRSHF